MQPRARDLFPWLIPMVVLTWVGLFVALATHVLLGGYWPMVAKFVETVVSIVSTVFVLVGGLRLYAWAWCRLMAWENRR